LRETLNRSAQMATPADGRQKILYVEDAPQARTLVRRLLAHRYDLLEAEDGLQGLEIARAEEPDLILMDINIPNIDGHEVTTRLKFAFPDVPIVALTADVSDGAYQRALAAGCDGYIPKPVDPDRFEQQVASFLAGRKEVLDAEEQEIYGRAYQQRLVQRLEEKVRELTAVIANNVRLNEQNLKLLAQAERRARLLQAAAEIGRNITSILDLDELLERTVDIICEAYGFYHAAIFLLPTCDGTEDEAGKWAVLRAGRGEAGKRMVEAGHRLAVGGNSTVGMAIAQRRAQVAPDVGQEARRSPPVAGQADDPLLPLTRSEIALPLIVGDEVIGALEVQSAEEAAFSEEDITALQLVADQLAVAINNARLLIDLEAAHRELVRTKTFEAIAATTGEAVHWVCNKAAPVLACVARAREDVARFIYVAAVLLDLAPESLREHEFAQSLRMAAEALDEISGTCGPNRQRVLDKLQEIPPEKLRRVLNVESTFEDLDIIESSARSILGIKENLIGPARKRKPRPLNVEDVVQDVVASMAIPPQVVELRFARSVPPVFTDETQANRIFTNLFKNALEAMEETEEKKLTVEVKLADQAGFVAVDVSDTGCGIPADVLDKIWITFYTTKGGKGGTGLGLSACLQMVNQMGGKIMVESEVGVGTTFTVLLPIAADQKSAD
jgi:signal transduction histidine kinase/DNA-binding NarL/FixJ family response regulator